MPCALIITTAGINCDRELGYAFELAGATAEFVHLNRLLDDPKLVERYDLIGLPGGFSYGDAIAAGRIAAVLMRRHLYSALVSAIQRGVPIIAPCNGFQIAAQVGLLPGPEPGEPWPKDPPRPTLSLAHNVSGRVVDRWCGVAVVPQTRCIWTQDLPEKDSPASMLPVAHGEGRFIPGSPKLLRRLERDGQIALHYQTGDNPNGSQGDIAGICDVSGLVLGLMPHPERFVRWSQHPHWTRLAESCMADHPLGIRMFRNAVARATQAATV